MSKSGRVLTVLGIVLVLGIFGAFSMYGLHNDPTELPSALLDRPFPEFEQPALDDPQRMLGRKDLLGRPALVNVWATWCPTCRAEHDYFNRLAATGVPIYGINYKDSTPKAQQWLRDLKDPYQLNVVDSQGRLGMELGVYGAPETFLIDAEGVIRFKYVGAIDEEVWTEKLEPVYRQLVAQ